MENTECKVVGEIWNANCEMGTSKIADKELKIQFTETFNQFSSLMTITPMTKVLSLLQL
jgi:hypothetical protein